jgi:hypothetical protein
MLRAIASTGTHQRADEWIQTVAWVALAVGFLCAFVVLFDMYARGYRPRMRMMEAVWPLTGLYLGPVMLWFYFRRGRKSSPKWMEEHPGDEENLGREVMGAPWFSVSKGVAHCGAGCTLGDIVGEWTVWLIGWSIPIFSYAAANELMAMYVADFVFAWSFGIAFQYFSIVPMNPELSGVKGVRRAIEADTLSIVAFQVGLFGWMALYTLVIWKPPLTVASPEHWFMMQVGMVIGFFTAWPANAWLIKKGVKEEM